MLLSFPSLFGLISTLPGTTVHSIFKSQVLHCFRGFLLNCSLHCSRLQSKGVNAAYIGRGALEVCSCNSLRNMF